MKRRMKKKGISQLIATVLIIVFVIAIALTIFSFARKTATGETTKSGDKAVAQDVCRDKVKIRVNSVNNDSGKLRIQVENLKKQTITDFVIRAESGSKVDIIKVKQLLNGYEKAVLTVDEKFAIDTIKVIPQITLKRPEITSVAEGWWLCSDQMATYKIR